MIRAGTKMLSLLVDRLAYGPEVSGDVSHLVEVRPLQSHEVEIVAANLNPARNASTHKSRLKLQAEGMLSYLIAWIDSTPVGHGMLLWNGPTGPPKQHIDRVCPYVEDLWVRKDLRSRGVGARMLMEMTLMARLHGYDSISLSVGVDNRRAIDLYERMGFQKAHIPRFTLSGIVSLSNGESQFWSEKCQYMRKSLDFSRDGEVKIV